MGIVFNRKVVDGKVTAVLGTHTHIPTADARLLDNKTAYQTDTGMTGDYNSVIGMDKENPIHTFTLGYMPTDVQLIKIHFLLCIFINSFNVMNFS